MDDNLAALFLLDPQVTFLNHGSFGACPRPVFEEYQRWQVQLESQPVAFLDPARGLSGWMRDARVALAGVLGTGPDNIVGVTNATAGLNIVAGWNQPEYEALGLTLPADHETRYGYAQEWFGPPGRRTLRPSCRPGSGADSPRPPSRTH